MPRTSLIYVLSLAVVAVLSVLVVFHHVSSDEVSNEVQSQQLIENEKEWILQFDIINRAGVTQDYTINVLVNDILASMENISLLEGRKFVYIHHLYREKLPESGNRVAFVVNRDSEPEPVETFTYYLR